MAALLSEMTAEMRAEMAARMAAEIIAEATEEIRVQERIVRRTNARMQEDPAEFIAEATEDLHAMRVPSSRLAGSASSLPALAATCPALAALTLPEVAANVAGCTELFEGVQATAANLAPMLERVRKYGYVYHLDRCLDANVTSDRRYGQVTHRGSVRIEKFEQGPRKQRTTQLDVRVEGPSEHIRMPAYVQNPSGPTMRAHADVAYKKFPDTIEGLADALAFGKDSMRRLRFFDICEDCRYDGKRDSEEHPKKKFKATPLPLCAECALKKSLGM